MQATTEWRVLYLLIYDLTKVYNYNPHEAQRARWIFVNFCASSGLSTKWKFGVHRLDYSRILKKREISKNYIPLDAQRTVWIIVIHCF